MVLWVYVLGDCVDILKCEETDRFREGGTVLSTGRIELLWAHNKQAEGGGEEAERKRERERI